MKNRPIGSLIHVQCLYLYVILTSWFLDLIPSLRNDAILHGCVSLGWFLELCNPNKMSMPVYCEYMESSLTVRWKKPPLKPLCGHWKKDHPILKKM